LELVSNPNTGGLANERASEPTRAASAAERLRRAKAERGLRERERAERSEPRERSEPAKRLARERVGESEGRSPSE
jgi:hypothetical protein